MVALAMEPFWHEHVELPKHLPINLVYKDNVESTTMCCVRNSDLLATTLGRELRLQGEPDTNCSNDG